MTTDSTTTDKAWTSEEDISSINMDIADMANNIRLGLTKPKELKLFPYQVGHFHRVADEIIPLRSGYLDGSTTGRGKTLIAGAVSVSYDIPLFVICPNITVKKVWLDLVTAYNIEYIDILTYEAIAGRKPSNMSDNEEIR